MSTPREPGYYWVRWGGACYVALLERVGAVEWWQITGVTLLQVVQDVEVISERLLPPEGA